MERPIRMVAILWMAMALSTMIVVAGQTSFEPVRINCGGPRYTDPDTKYVWKGDSKKYLTGTPGYQYSKCSNRYITIANTTKGMRGVYCSNRFFKPNVGTLPNFYTIPVLNTTASYIVRLHFAEIVRLCQLYRFTVSFVSTRSHFIHFWFQNVRFIEKQMYANWMYSLKGYYI